MTAVTDAELIAGLRKLTNLLRGSNYRAESVTARDAADRLELLAAQYANDHDQAAS
jgi:hypothetical protein